MHSKIIPKTLLSPQEGEEKKGEKKGKKG